jgi:hypothetical protein
LGVKRGKKKKGRLTACDRLIWFLLILVPCRVPFLCLQGWLSHMPSWGKKKEKKRKKEGGAGAAAALELLAAGACGGCGWAWVVDVVEAGSRIQSAFGVTAP